MPVTIKVNGTANSLVHKFSNGISIATLPDVCKTPSPGGPVPIPYPNIAQSITLSDGTTTVKTDRAMAAIKGSKFAMSNGDNAGTLGGVKSSTFMKEATWILYSFDVKMNGKGAARLTDKMFHNHENAANLAGVTQIPRYVDDDDQNVLCHIFCETRKKGQKAKKKDPDKRFDYSREAEAMSKKEPYKTYFKDRNMVPERNVLVEVAAEHLGTRSARTTAQAATRISNKIAQKVLGYTDKFLPIVNIGTLVVDPAVATTGLAGKIGDAMKNGTSLVRVRPDVSVLGPQSEITKIYDYKFDYEGGGKDSFQNHQQEIYQSMCDEEPVEISFENCNECQSEGTMKI